MKTLKESFGRRLAVIIGSVIAILIALAVVASFSTQAKADNATPNEDGWERMHAYEGGAWLTSIVQAPDNASFNYNIKWNFTPVSKCGIPYVDDYYTPMPSVDAQLNFRVENGEIKNPDSPDPTSSLMPIAFKRQGPGAYATEGIEPPAPDSGDADAKYAENGAGTYWKWTNAPAARGYVAQFPLNMAIQERSSEMDKAGEYVWEVTQVISDSEQVEGWSYSQASYTFKMFVSQHEGDSWLTIDGFQIQQNKDDKNNSILIEKKDPRRGYGNSNALVGWTAQGYDATSYYKGFTFVNLPPANLCNFYLQKFVQTEYPDWSEQFSVQPEFYYQPWEDGTVITGALVDINTTSETPTYSNPVRVDLTVQKLDDKNYHAAYVTKQGSETVTDRTLKIKHMQRLVFDGEEYFDATAIPFTTTKLPEGTTYGYIEDNSAPEKLKYDASALTYTATSDQSVKTEDDASAHKLTVSYDDDVKTAIISAPPADHPGYTNHSDITNAYTYTPTGFLIDILPYVLMLGIPLVAFIIWMIGRKRKLNR